MFSGIGRCPAIRPGLGGNAATPPLKTGKIKKALR
jgi:hypothetical protein